MAKWRFFWLSGLFLLLFGAAQAQEKTSIRGRITDGEGKPVPYANILIPGTSTGTQSDSLGSYSLKLPSGREMRVMFSLVGYDTAFHYITLEVNEVKTFNVILRRGIDLGQVDVIDESIRTSPMKILEPNLVNKIPSAGGHFEGILASQPGVVTTSELSSQYSVRGGSFDENLVYVNGIEVYRPFLVRSGNQEGLSFINADLVAGVLFSAGGFEARYGDKMSSVLDITYKEPKAFEGSVSGGLLGGAVHLGLVNESEFHRFTQIHGFRYRTNQYLLGSLETDGAYNPRFTDYQGFFTYQLTNKSKFEWLINYSRNRYEFVPENRQTDFGTINEALRLTVFFDGQEVDDYETVTGAMTYTVRPKENVSLKFISSAFRTQESETFDIEGAYRLDELERDLSQSDFGDVAFNRGVGSFLDHARNYLTASVYTFQHRGKWFQTEKQGNNEIQWGFKAQHEDITDELSEWGLIDSAGFSVPQTPTDEIQLFEVIKSDNAIASNRFSGYTQWSNLWEFPAERDSTGKIIRAHELTMNAGGRITYWDYNNQTLLSPRVTLAFKPDWNPDILFRASWGYYHQPPFYRELRDLTGTLNPNLQAQTSIHYVLASDYNFKMWDRPFKWVTEVYYKQLRNLVPYELDNVRIRYYAENSADGFSTGIDMKLHGEFVEGTDSWASLSVLTVQEDIKDDFYYDFFNAAGEKIVPGFTSDQVAVDSVRNEPGYIPRPTDRRVNFGMFFQDYIPGRPTWKMHLNFLYGTGLPFGPPSFERYRDTLRMPAYRRVDIGFSKQLLGENNRPKPESPFRHFKDIWISAEIFNLLQVNNTISYLWVTDVANRQYAIPNFLTARRINVKLITRF